MAMAVGNVVACARVSPTAASVVAPCAAARGRGEGAGGLVSFVGLRGIGKTDAPRSLACGRSGNWSRRGGGGGGAPQQRGVRAATVVAPKFTAFKPLGDRVLVELQKQEEKSLGGILLPTSAQTKPQSGAVVEVGEGKQFGDKKIEIGVAKGDSVIYSKFAGTEVEFNGKDYLLLREDDIVGSLEGDDIKNLKPLNDRVLIKVAEAEAKSAGGVLLTDSAKEKPQIGEIVAAGAGTVGEDGTKKPLELAQGNTVLYSKFAGNEFKGKDGSSFVVLRAADVLAVLS